MKNLFILIAILFNITLSYAECVHEKTVYGSEINSLLNQHEVFVETKNALFVSASKLSIKKNQNYKVQLFPKKSHLKSSGDYNSKYIEYYTYPRIQKYLEDNSDLITKAGMEVMILIIRIVILMSLRNIINSFQIINVQHIQL